MTEWDEERVYVEAQRAAVLADLALTLEQRAVLDKLTNAKTAWSPVRGLERGGLAPALADLERIGVVTRWADPYVGRLKRDVCTLTSWGAWVLGLELDERGPDEIPFWVEEGSELTPIREASPTKTFRLVHPQLVVDPTPGPLEQLLLDEVSGEPVTLLGGYTVAIDPKLKPGKRAG